MPKHTLLHFLRMIRVLFRVAIDSQKCVFFKNCHLKKMLVKHRNIILIFFLYKTIYRRCSLLGKPNIQGQSAFEINGIVPVATRHNNG